MRRSGAKNASSSTRRCVLAGSAVKTAVMARAWSRFGGDILLICSGDDLTAREFIDHAASDVEWAGLVDGSQVSRCTLAEADHTFSRAEWRDRVASLTADWLDERSTAPSGPTRRTIEAPVSGSAAKLPSTRVDA